MATAHHIELSDAPDCIRAAVAQCGKHGGTIPVLAAKEWYGGGGAFTGNRAIAVAVNLQTGQTSDALLGSWGGSNPFVDNPMDAPNVHPIAPGHAIVAGETGGRGTFVRCFVHPDSFAPLLKTEEHELSETAQRCLDVHCFLNSRGRREYFERHGWSADKLAKAKAELAAKGLLKVSRNGAAKVTAAGKNATKDQYVY